MDSEGDRVLVVVCRATVAGKGGCEPIAGADDRGFGVHILKGLEKPEKREWGITYIASLLLARGDLTDIHSCARTVAMGFVFGCRSNYGTTIAWVRRQETCDVLLGKIGEVALHPSDQIVLRDNVGRWNQRALICVVLQCVNVSP